MQKKLHFVVVCGYGCNIESPLAPYLGRVADFLRRQLDVESVILCGGETQKTKFPRRSEARVMYDYLNKCGLPMGFVLEENSYTTYDNIKLAAEIIKRLRDGQTAQVGGRPHIKFRITIFCEAQRALKVIMLARHFMSDLVKDIDDIQVETYNWERADPRRELKSTIMTWLAIRFPSIARQERDKRFDRSHYL